MPEPTFLVALGALGKTIQLLTSLESLIDKFRVLSKRDARAIGDALDEVHKELQAVYELTEQWRRLALEPDFKRAAPAVLASLAGPKTLVRVRHNGGSCTEIGLIRDGHLNGWFKQILKRFSPGEYRTAKRIFEILATGDDGLFEDMEQLCNFIGGEAALASQLASKKEWAAARKKVQQTQSQLVSAEVALAQAMQILSRARKVAMKRAGGKSLRSPPATASASA